MSVLDPLSRLVSRFLHRVQGGLPSWSHPATPEVRHSHVSPVATYSPWLSDKTFLELFESLRNHTLVDVYRCWELWTLARQLEGVEGDVLEVGVWRGGTGCLLAKAAEGSGKKTFLADTFRGVVKAGPRDTVYSGGEHADASADEVRQLLSAHGFGDAVLLEGTFPDETGGRGPAKLSLAHIDVDVYQSAKDAAAWIMPRLSPGGALVFDDYGFSGCEGVTRLVDELRGAAGWLFIHNLNGHGILIKR